MVLTVDDDQRRIVLTRRPHRWIVFDGKVVGHLLGEPALERDDCSALYKALTNTTHERFLRRIAIEETSCVLSTPEGDHPVEIRQEERAMVVRIRLPRP